MSLEPWEIVNISDSKMEKKNNTLSTTISEERAFHTFASFDMLDACISAVVAKHRARVREIDLEAKVNEDIGLQIACIGTDRGRCGLVWQQDRARGKTKAVLNFRPLHTSVYSYFFLFKKSYLFAKVLIWKLFLSCRWLRHFEDTMWRWHLVNFKTYNFVITSHDFLRASRQRF